MQNLHSALIIAFALLWLTSMAVATFAERTKKMSYGPAFIMSLIFSPLIAILLLSWIKPQLVVSASAVGLPNVYVSRHNGACVIAQRVPFENEFFDEGGKSAFILHSDKLMSLANWCNGLPFVKGNSCEITFVSNNTSATAKAGEWIVKNDKGFIVMREEVFDFYYKKEDALEYSPL